MNEIDDSEWEPQTSRGLGATKYDLFYHPLFFPNNTWLWKFVPGVIIGFVGSLLLFGNRLRNPRRSRFEDENEGSIDTIPCREPPRDVKLMLVINTDLKGMRPGKMGAQCGHAAGMVVKKLMKHHPKLLSQWEACGTKKICLKGLSKEHLESLSQQATRARILVTPVFDAGKTQIAEGSLTVVAIGPAEAALLHPITGDLKLMS